MRAAVGTQIAFPSEGRQHQRRNHHAKAKRDVYQVSDPYARTPGISERTMNTWEDTMDNNDVKVKDLMATNVSTLGRNDTLDLADNVMTLDRIRHLPVLDEKRVVGVVSQRDLFRSALAVALGYGERAQAMLLKTLRVKEVMSEPAITISSEAPIKDAARLMIEKKIGCLPVVEGGRLVGIVTETDILRHVVGS
jgi:CBS domain-containing protein